MTARVRRSRAALALFAAGWAACFGCYASGPHSRGRSADLSGLIPFVWPRDGSVTLMTCRFETALPIGFAVENATREERYDAEAVLRAWERASLGVRFIAAPIADAQLAIAFGDEPAAEAGRSFADCQLNGERAELASARVEIARNAAGVRGAARALSQDERLGVLAREVGRALGWSGSASAGDPLRVSRLATAARVGAAVRAGAPLTSPALSALYAQASGSVIARATAARPLATRPVDRLAVLAAAHQLEGPFLRTGVEAGRVFWRDRTSGEEYGALVVAPARLVRAPGRVTLALEPRARRALPRSRDPAPESRETPRQSLKRSRSR